MCLKAKETMRCMCSLVVWVSPHSYFCARKNMQQSIIDLEGKWWNMADLDMWDSFVVRKDITWRPTDLEIRLCIIGLVQGLPDYFQLHPDLLEAFRTILIQAPQDVLRDLVWRHAREYEEAEIVPFIAQPVPFTVMHTIDNFFASCSEDEEKHNDNEH